MAKPALGDLLAASVESTVSDTLKKSSPELHRLICTMAADGESANAIAKRCVELGASGEMLRYCQQAANHQVRLATAH